MFKILGLKYASYISGKIISFIGPYFRSKDLIRSNILKALPSLKDHEIDDISKKINLITKLIMSLIILFLIVILANPWSNSSTITQIGKGAQLVFVIDRSVSMAKPFIGGDSNKSEIKSLAARRILKDFIKNLDENQYLFGIYENNVHVANFKLTINRRKYHGSIF